MDCSTFLQIHITLSYSRLLVQQLLVEFVEFDKLLLDQESDTREGDVEVRKVASSRIRQRCGGSRCCPLPEGTTFPPNSRYSNLI